jgi:hypothetical protein
MFSFVCPDRGFSETSLFVRELNFAATRGSSRPQPAILLSRPRKTIIESDLVERNMRLKSFLVMGIDAGDQF